MTPNSVFRAVLGSSRSGDGHRGVADKTFGDLDWQRICDAIAQRCLGRDAQELAADLGLLPSLDVCERRRREVDEASAAVQRNVVPPLRGFDALGDSLVRARKQDILSTEDLARIGRSAESSERVRAWARSAGAMPLVAEHCERLVDVREVASEIARCVDASGQIADAASPELGPLRRRVARLREGILARLDKMVKSPRYEGILQDDYVTIRDERYVLPVRAGEKGDFPGIVHGQSGSGQTLFIEPQELIESNNDLRMSQLDVENEVRRILRRLSDLVARRADDLEANQDVLVYLDLTFAMARLCADLRCTLALIDTAEVPTIRLERARHPVLALRELEGELSVVANDIRLEGANGLVISGPNTGGKTVTLKTVGLCALMTRAGLTIPVDRGSVVPWFEQLHSDIGDEQGVDRDLSTFSGHVANISGFLPMVRQRALVLLDELFAGTDPEQGTALGRALLEELAERGASIVVTTHLEGLKTLGLEDARFAVASVGFDVEGLRPTYELRNGIPGSSYALRIASRLGLDARVIERAEAGLGGGGAVEREALLERLENEHTLLGKLRAEAETLRDEVRAEAVALREKRKRLADKLAAEADNETRLLVDEARRLKGEVRRLSKVLRDAVTPASEAEAEALRQKLAEARDVSNAAEGVRRKVGQVLPGAESVRAALEPSGVSVGDTVWVATFKRSGSVLGVDAAAGRALVQIGPLRTNVVLSDLRESALADTVAVAAEEARGGVRLDVERSADNTVDLRGDRVDEALDKLDAFLDRAARASMPALFVIHGHGTGALKRAVRDHLARVPYAIEWRPGGQGEGGDGATVVQFE